MVMTITAWAKTVNIIIGCGTCINKEPSKIYCVLLLMKFDIIEH